MQAIWKPISGHEGHYEVSNLGQVRTVERQVLIGGGRMRTVRSRVLSPFKAGIGYLAVTLSADNIQQKRYVHRLVADAFLENTAGLPEVNHIDADKENNLATNLEWCDRIGNVTHSASNNLLAFGSRNGASKLSAGDVLDIQLLCLGGASQMAVAILYDVTQSSISRIMRGMCWARDTGLEKPSRTGMIGNSRLNVDQVAEIRRRLSHGERRKDLASLFNVSASAIDGIATGRNWPGVI